MRIGDINRNTINGRRQQVVASASFLWAEDLGLYAPIAPKWPQIWVPFTELANLSPERLLSFRDMQSYQKNSSYLVRVGWK